MKKMLSFLSDFWHSGLHILLVFIAALSAYWYYEDDVYEFRYVEQEYQVIESGSFLSIKRDVCPAKGNVEMYVWRFAVDEEGIQYLISHSPYPPVYTCGEIKLNRFIPSHIPEGKYKYIVVATYQINPMIKATKILQPVEFEVRNGE